jgi:hypothetical protein
MSEFTEAKRLEVIEKLKEIFPQGLVRGLGNPKPGELCVEAAICLALGEPHSDKPSCVHEVDREFAIVLNDSAWSSDKARAEAMLPLAIAQLGTAGKDRTEWVKRVIEGTIRKILPMALRAAADAAANAAYYATYYATTAINAINAVAKAAYNSADYAEYADYYAAAAAKAAYYASQATGNDEPLKMAVQIAIEAYASEA